MRTWSFISLALFLSLSQIQLLFTRVFIKERRVIIFFGVEDLTAFEVAPHRLLGQVTKESGWASFVRRGLRRLVQRPVLGVLRLVCLLGLLLVLAAGRLVAALARGRAGFVARSFRVGLVRSRGNVVLPAEPFDARAAVEAGNGWPFSVPSFQFETFGLLLVA